MKYRSKLESLGFRYVKYKNRFEKGNLSLDLENMVAYSYEWYRIYEKINGKHVVDTFAYSKTTSRHMTEMMRVISRVFDVPVVDQVRIEAPHGLANLKAAVQLYKDRI